jgi:mRNA interferase RelE/StbE
VADYSVEIKASAKRELDAIDDSMFARIDRKITGLSLNPRPPGCRKLKGYRNLWRIRVGDWRIVYSVDDSKMVVTIDRVAHRGEVYDS